MNANEILYSFAIYLLQVYIVRSNEVDCNFPLVRVDPPIKQTDTGKLFQNSSNYVCQVAS